MDTLNHVYLLTNKQSYTYINNWIFVSFYHSCIIYVGMGKKCIAIVYPYTMKDRNFVYKRKSQVG